MAAMNRRDAIAALASAAALPLAYGCTGGGSSSSSSGPGPEADALALVDRIALHDFHLFHSIRADLLRRLGRDGQALLAYDAALGLTSNAAERAFLERRRAALRAGR